MPSSPEPVRYLCRRLSYAGIDDESAFVMPIQDGGFFLNFAHARETRAALQHGAKLGVLPGSCHGKDLNPAVPKIAYETTYVQLICGGLCVKTIAYALDHAGDKIPFRLFRVAHKPTKL